MPIKIKYTGPCKDYSGYGEANRHDVGSLVAAGIEVTTQIPNYTLEISDFGHLGELAASLEGRELGYRIKILHTTPNVYPAFMEPGKYHIGRAFWETDKLPLDFAAPMQKMDEIWTGSEYNLRAIRNAGVTKPIYIIPEAIDDSLDVSTVKPYMIANTNDYKFYSIFEWTERKNPGALLTAFWQEFEHDENVSLTLKTYVDNFTPEKRKEIDMMIKRIKKRLNLTRYAPVYTYRNLMDRYQIYRLHKTFDCFVSAHRGEGWGVPQMEALLLENPVISTNCGGIHEYLRDKEDALLIPYTLTQIGENSRNKQWYTPDQKWAEVDTDVLRSSMRWVFNNQEAAKKLGRRGRTTVVNTFSLSAVGERMRSRLKEITDKLLEQPENI